VLTNKHHQCRCGPPPEEKYDVELILQTEPETKLLLENKLKNYVEDLQTKLTQKIPINLTFKTIGESEQNDITRAFLLKSVIAKPLSIKKNEADCDCYSTGVCLCFSKKRKRSNIVSSTNSPLSSDPQISCCEGGCQCSNTDQGCQCSAGCCCGDNSLLFTTAPCDVKDPDKSNTVTSERSACCTSKSKESIPSTLEIESDKLKQ
jgi:hypothetical protein